MADFVIYLTLYMKNLYLTLLFICFTAVFCKAQTLYGATTTGMKDRVIGFLDGDKIYNATAFGMKDRIIGFLQTDKIYYATKFQLKDKVAAFIDKNTLYYASTFEMKASPAAVVENGKIYASDSGGLKGRVIGYADGAGPGVACAAILLILKWLSYN